MSDLGDGLRRVAARQFGTSFARKASPSLLLATTDRAFAVQGETARGHSFIVELEDDDDDPGSADFVPGVGVDTKATPTRASFEPTVQAVAAELGTWSSASTGRPGPPAIDVLWLVRSLRIRSSLDTLAFLSEHNVVRHIDVSRRLHFDSSTGAVTGAPAAYRRAVERLRQALPGDGTGISIALIDGEVDVNHPQLAGRCRQAGRYTEENWGVPSNHGTALAGLLLGTSTVPGVAPGATVENYKVHASLGTMVEDGDLIMALQDVIDARHPVAVCALSLEPGPDDPGRLPRALRRAAARGVVVCKSAGNAGPAPGSLSEPRGGAGTVVIGACDAVGTRVMSYSGRGPARDGIAAPNVVAPGGGPGDALWAAHSGGGEGPVPWGTSNSTAVVAGVLAALASVGRGRTLAELRRELAALARPIPNASADDQGAGAVVVG